MEQKHEMLDFVKAMSDVDRLRIIGLLSQKPASLAKLAEELHMPSSDVFNHVAYLVHVGVAGGPLGGEREEGHVRVDL